MGRGLLVFVLSAALGWACVSPTPYGEKDSPSPSKTGDDDDTTTSSSSSSSGAVGGIDAGGPSDGGSLAGTRCSPTDPFSPATLISEVSDPVIDEWSVTLTGDELTMIINRGNDDEILGTKRSAIGSPFSPPTAIEAGFYDPLLSNDGRLFFSVSDSNHAIAEQPRDAMGGLGTAKPLTLSGFSEPRWDNPSLSVDGSTLCWGNEPGSTKIYHVKCATLNGTTLSNVTTFPSLESFGDAFAPVFSPDRLTLFFSHAESDGGEHIYMATRASTNADFGAPVPRTELNRGAGSHEIPKLVSADACRLYLVTTPAQGNFDVYLATRTPK